MSLNCPICNIYIDEHPASECLDEWIARDVMGWEQHWFNRNTLTWEIPTEFQGESAIRYVPQESFRPSTDIAAAWDAVEKIDLVLDLEWDKRSTCVTLTWNSGYGDLKSVTAIGGKPSLAICRAAIKAKVASDA